MKRLSEPAVSEVESKNGSPQVVFPNRCSNFRWLGPAMLMLLFVYASPDWAGAQVFTSLHSFNGTNGNGPAYGALVEDSAGNLYGSTYEGGVEGGCFGSGCGVIFKLDAAGNETVLHNFLGSPLDGGSPEGSLLLDGAMNLYGVTTFGGSNCGNGCGTVFKLDSLANESILYDFNFSGITGGEIGPINLIQDGVGNFYGTTINGGSPLPNLFGTVFKLDSSNNETVLHNFTNTDGANPYGALTLDASGNLYGTTLFGGSLNDCSGRGCGVVYKLDSSGNETVVHSFTGVDGAYPFGGLVMDASGNLYGTTEAGGTFDAGTVFKIDAAGNFNVIYNFTGQGDGGYPFGALITDYQGNFYGTAEEGGLFAECPGSGCGLVFEVDSSGNETVIHSFSVSDGAFPVSTLLMDTGRDLYGTTLGGGTSGDGTAFKIALGTPFSAIATKLALVGGAAPGFAMKADFSIAALSSTLTTAAVNPVAQSVAIKVGTYSVIIPSGSFKENKKGAYVYSGTIKGVSLQIRITQTGPASYEAQVTASGVNLNGLTGKIPVTLSVGYNTGSTD